MRNITLILFAIFSINTYASESLFNKANELYSQEKYTDAILLYDSISSNGLESSDLYYNLGNCYYKISDWANAIWHYEKSLKIDKKEITKHNLALVNLKKIDLIEPLPQLFYKKWWISTVSIFNTKRWQVLTLICIWITLLILVISHFCNHKKWHLLISFITIFLVSFVLLIISHSSYLENYKKNEAIIFSSSVVVNSAPTKRSTNLFSLHSGSKVEITDTIGEWIKIKITNGNSGWIKSNNCKVVK